MEKPKFSDLFTNSNTNDDFITTVTKKVINDHKKITSDHAAREKNVMVFNCPEEKPNDPEDVDKKYFKTMCIDVLEMKEIPEAKVMRIGDKKEGKARPLKICFSQVWDKRIFLSSLSKLQQHPSYKNTSVKHDMSIEDRAENKRLLKKAYQQNLKF